MADRAGAPENTLREQNTAIELLQVFDMLYEQHGHIMQTQVTGSERHIYQTPPQLVLS